MVQLTIALPTSLTSFNLQENLFNDFNGILFHPNVDFLIKHTPFHGLFPYGLPFHIHPSMSRTSSGLQYLQPPLTNPSPGTCSVFFQSRTTITYVTTHHTRTLHFSSIYDFRMPSQHSKPTRIHNNNISKFIPRHHNDQETSAFW